MDLEPIGEERADLRMGALASVLLNINIDTKKIGGLIQPRRYITGWGDDRVYVMVLKQEDEKESVEEKKPDINDPSVWNSFVRDLSMAIT